MRIGTNQYEVTYTLGERTDSVKVNCNNPVSAIQKGSVLMIRKTGVTGWKYKTHRLVRRGWEDDVVSISEQNRRIGIEMSRRGRIG